MSDLFSAHGGFRKLRSFQVAQQVYDATIVFCNRFIDKRPALMTRWYRQQEAAYKISQKAVLQQRHQKKLNLNLPM